MTREEELRQAVDNISEAHKYEEDLDYLSLAIAFEEGAEWADDNPKSPWIKFTEKCPPQQEPIIIAVKNKNKEDGIWLYDLCMFFGGDYTNNENWENKINWEIPIYWMPIPNLSEE